MISIDALMKKHTLTAGPKDSVADAARRMGEAGVGAVVVVDGQHLAGIFTERDLLTRVVGAGRDPATTPVGSVATREVVSVAPGTSLRECAEALKTHGVRHLPVVRDGEVVGIISARDFFETVAGGLERLIERVRYDELLRENIDPYDHLGGSYGR